jgi:hypothetical protein
VEQQWKEFVKGGIRLHEVIADDPMDLGAVKIDTNEWVEANCDWYVYYPLVGKLVFVVEMLEDQKLYWFGVWGEWD